MFHGLPIAEVLQLVLAARAALKTWFDGEEGESVADFVVVVCTDTWDRNPDTAPKTFEERVAYTCAAARREAARISQRQPRGPVLADPDAIPGARERDPGDTVALDDLQQRVLCVIRTALAELSVSDRELFLTRSAGISYDAICARGNFRGVRVATLRKRVERTLAEVSRRVQGAQLPPEASVLLEDRAWEIWGLTRSAFGFTV